MRHISAGSTREVGLAGQGLPGPHARPTKPPGHDRCSSSGPSTPVVDVMTMSDQAGNEEIPQPRFNLLNTRREALDLTKLLDGAPTPGSAWTAAPRGAAHGLIVELDGHRAEIALDRDTFVLAETSSPGAPSTLQELAKSTYLRYLDACLSIGHFALESVPVEGPNGATKHESLRLGAVSLGARWLEQLPPRTPLRLPLRSELTIIDGPPPAEDAPPA